MLEGDSNPSSNVFILASRGAQGAVERHPQAQHREAFEQLMGWVFPTAL